MNETRLSIKILYLFYRKILVRVFFPEHGFSIFFFTARDSINRLSHSDDYRELAGNHGYPVTFLHGHRPIFMRYPIHSWRTSSVLHRVRFDM